jgi:hypothetical protein
LDDHGSRNFNTEFLVPATGALPRQRHEFVRGHMRFIEELLHPAQVLLLAHVGELLEGEEGVDGPPHEPVGVHETELVVRIKGAMIWLEKYRSIGGLVLHRMPQTALPENPFI